MLLYNENSRNKLLKILFTFSTLSFLHESVYAGRVMPLNDNTFHDNCPEKCHSDTCGDEALRFIKLMNDQVDPCENFYEFACGTYIRDTPLGETDNAVSIVVTAQSEITDDAFADLAEKVKGTDLDAFKKVKNYFRNCINKARIEQAGTAPLMEILNDLGGWPVLLWERWDERRFDLFRTIFKTKELKFPGFFPVILSVTLDNLDSTKYAINLQIADNDVDASWFADSDRNKILRPFLEYMMKVVTILGGRNDSQSMREMQQVSDLEVELFNIATPPEQLVEMPIEEKRFSIRQLASKYPSIPWLEFINKVLLPTGIRVNENEMVYLADPAFVSKVVKLIERTPKRVLANYVGWSIVQLSMPCMPKNLNDAQAEFKSVQDGTAGGMDEFMKCYTEVTEMFPLGLSAMYVRKHLKDNIESDISEMFENIRSQTRKTLQELDWMDDTTKRAALEKLDAMQVTIGYAKELMDDRKDEEYYRDLEVNPGSLLQSAFNVSFFTETKNNRKLRQNSDQDKWTAKQSVVELNAYNVVQENSIELPAGFLKSFYKLGRPQYINYGVVASFIGHEIFHGFDNQGRQYDKHGNQVSWWAPSAEQKFKRKAQCIIDQYSNYTVEKVNLKVNGELSQGENIADNGGYRTAYLAYKEWARRHNPEGCLPSLNYTPNQMFWISAASVWCSKEREEYIRQTMTTDPHSPDEARVMIVFSNIKEFADDFKCKPGSRMNPEKRCKVW